MEGCCSSFIIGRLISYDWFHLNRSLNFILEAHVYFKVYDCHKIVHRVSCCEHQNISQFIFSCFSIFSVWCTFLPKSYRLTRNKDLMISFHKTFYTISQPIFILAHRCILRYLVFLFQNKRLSKLMWFFQKGHFIHRKKANPFK